MLLGKNCTSVTWRQFGQSYFGAFVPESLKSNCGSLTWKKLHKRYLEIIVPVSLNKIQPVLLRSNCASFTWKQYCYYHLEKIVSVSLENNCAWSKIETGKRVNNLRFSCNVAEKL